MSINRRRVLAGLAAGLMVPGRAFAGGADESDPPLIPEDYAVARRTFRTHLLRRGPAPDDPQPLTPPPGARAVPYRSGPLDLVAWLSTDPTRSAIHPGPAVLVLHGGNALWPGHFDDLARPYVAAGYIAMMPALRGENGLPGDFSGFYDETSDVLAAADVLRAQPGVDPERLYLAGHSVGGTLTLLAAMASPMFRAASAFSGSADARAFFAHFPEDVRFDTSDPREFQMRSAVCFAPSFKCPLLMLHGSQEHRSEAVTKLTVERARAAGRRVESGVVAGSHMSAIPGEVAESLRFFAGVG